MKVQFAGEGTFNSVATIQRSPTNFKSKSLLCQKLLPENKGALYWKQTIFQYFQYRSLTANSANLSFRNSLKQVGFTKPSVLEVLYCLTWIYIYLWPKIPNGRTLTACWDHCNFKRAKNPYQNYSFFSIQQNSSEHVGIIKHALC